MYEHNVSNHTNQQHSRYGGGNLYDHDNINLPVLTLSTTDIENIAESTRVESSTHRYQCEKCEYNSSYMDELLMHNNMEHRVDSGNVSRNQLSVTIVEDSEDIIDLVPKKRKNSNNCNRTVKKIKYKLYD